MRSTRRVTALGLSAGIVTGLLVAGPAPVATAEQTTVDVSFGVSGTAAVPASPLLASGAGYGNGLEVAATAQNWVYVAGEASGDDIAVTRLDADGLVDPSFGDGGSVSFGVSSGDDAVADIEAMPDGGMLALVRSYIGPGDEYRLVRLLGDGSFDPDFGQAGVLEIPAPPGSSIGYIADLTGGMHVGTDGSIVLGAFIDGDVQRGIVKITPSGELATFADNGWFLFPDADWSASDGFFMDVDSQLGVVVYTVDSGRLHRLSPSGVVDASFSLAEVSADGLYVGADDRLVTWRRAYEYFPGSTCQYLALDTRLNAGPLESSESIFMGCNDGLEDVREVTSNSRVGFVLSEVGGRVRVRRIGPSGTWSEFYGINGVASTPSGFSPMPAAASLTVDDRSRPIVAFRDQSQAPPFVDTLKVTRFRRGAGDPLEIPSEQLTGSSRPGGQFIYDPVDTATGNLTGSWTDLEGEAFGLTVTRAYNGLSTLSSPVGDRWSVSTGPSMFDDSGVVTMVMPDGARYRFLADGEGGYLPAEGVAGALTVDNAAVPSGGGPLPMLKLIYEDGSVDTFDTAGRLLARTSWDGQSATSTYGPNGVVSVAASTGQSLTFTYDGSGRLSEVATSSGRAVTYGYDGAGRLSTVTDEFGGQWTITYTTEGWLKTLTDPSGVVLEDNTYDPQGRVIEQRLPPNVVVFFSYDPVWGETIVEEFVDDGVFENPTARFRYLHDSSGKVTSIEQAGGPASTKLYDELGNLVGNVTRMGRDESATFDGYNLTSVTDPASGTTTYTYDTADRVTSMTSPEGGVTTYTYDGAERSPSSVTDPLGNTSTFDVVDGLVMSSTDADGVTTTFTYDAHRRLTATADEYGNITTRTYDAQGRLIALESAEGHTTTWTYGLTGRLQSTTAPDGGITSYTYDPAGRVLTTTDPTGAVTTNTYDAAGNLESVTDPDGHVTTYGYDYAGRQTSMTAPGGAVTETEREQFGWLYNERTPLGNNTLYSRDAEGQVLSEYRYDVGDYTTYEYDTAGRRTSTTDEAGRVSTQTYDTFGRIASTIAPGGATTTYDYDALSRPIETIDSRGGVTATTYTPGGRIASTTDAAALTTTYGYDLAGRRVTVTEPGNRTTTNVYDGDGRVSSVTSPGGLVTSYTYDPAGRVTSITDPAGVVTTRTYTLRGELATEKIGAQGTVTYSYNPTGTLASVTDPKGALTSFTYDGRGNMLTRTNALGGIDTWTYNLADQVLTAEDPLGRVTTMTYDTAGQLTATTDPSGRTTELTYNDDGTPASRTTGVGDTTYLYDAAGRIASITDATGTMSYTYNTAGDVTSMTTPSGAVTSWTYDQAGRRTSMRYPDGRGVGYRYDAAGDLVSIVQSELLIDRFGLADGAVPSSVNWTRTLSTGSTATVQAAAVVLSVPDTASASALLTSKVPAQADSEVTLSYRFASTDPATRGRLVVYGRFTSSGHYRAEIEAGASTGTVVKRVGSTNTTLGSFPVPAGTDPYQLRMKVIADTVSVTAWNPAAGDEPAATTFTSAGVATAGTARVQLQRVAGSSTVTVDVWVQSDPVSPRVIAGYAYNADRQVISETLLGGTRTSTYTNGYRTGFNQTVAGAVRSTTVSYDSTGRVASETTGTTTTSYGYDAASQLVSVTPSTGSAITYSYDALGRRASDKVGTAAATKYVYDAAGQLCWTTTKSLPATPACGAPLSGAATFTWDPAGRMLNETRTATNRVDYTYDPEGRLATVVRVNGTATTTQARTYTPDGMLASTVNTGASTSSSQYSWDPLAGQVPQLAAITTGTVTSNLTYGPTGWVGLHSSAALAPVAVATDVHGSVIPSTGNTLARNASYSAFGVASGSNTFEPRLGYRGELTLDNQLWLRARSYQPTVGRFTTRDPAPGRSGTTTLADPYHYGDNNPLNRIDPTGTISQSAANGDRPGPSRAIGASGQVLTPAEIAASDAFVGGQPKLPQAPFVSPEAIGLARECEQRRQGYLCLAARAVVEGLDPAIAEQLALDYARDECFVQRRNCDLIDFGGVTQDPWLNFAQDAIVGGFAAKLASAGLGAIAGRLAGSAVAGRGVSSGLADDAARLTLPRGGANLSQQQLDHIIARHWYGSQTVNAGHFAPGTTGRGLTSMIDDTVRVGTPRPNTAGRPGTIYELDLGRTVGTNAAGSTTSRLRVVVDPSGNVITAFPY